MNLESYFISQLQNRHIGDDGALLDGMVYSKDAFFENVHFKKEWMSHYDIARKAMLVNISDAVAMNAKPLYALLSVAMPKSISKREMKELAEGFLDVAKAYGIEIIGGDTISNSKLDITITIVSKSKQPLLRKGLRENHLVAYSGELGASSRELKKLFNLGRLHKKSKFKNIVLREKFIEKTARYLSSGMDISDGLFSDLDKLAQTNRLGFKFYKKVTKSVGCSGEEYEMLISFPKSAKKALLRRAKQTRTKITIFAISKRRRYQHRCKSHHF